MLEILKFIFSNFWTFFGTIWLIMATGASLNAVIVAFRGVAVKLIAYNDKS